MRQGAGLALAALLTAAIQVPSSAAAGVTIKGNRPSATLTVEVEGASVETILGKLGKKFGFEFVAPSGSGSSPPWSATLRGDLDAIVARLLRNRNHSIIRSTAPARRIRRIVLIDARSGSKLAPMGPYGSRSRESRRRQRAKKPKAKPAE